MKRTIGIVLTVVLALLLGMALRSSTAYADVPGLETKVASGTANANSVKTLAVACSSGKKALGGGVEVPTSGLVQVLASVPQGATGDGSDNASGWVGEYLNNDSAGRTVYVWVICATIGA